jgi:hypothetical protein
MTMVAATIPRKMMMHNPKRSSGRTPKVYANMDIPEVEFGGSVKRRFGTVGSM